MRKIGELIGTGLKWQQPSALRMEYELRAGSELVATLDFRSSFGSFATGKSADGCWTFKRVGFWQTRATVRPCNSDSDIASFKHNTWSSGGTLELADGGSVLASTNFWQTKFEFTTESGETLIKFNTGGLLHLSATVGIEPIAVKMRELPWMVILGWYLVVTMYSDATVAAGAATAS